MYDKNYEDYMSTVLGYNINQENTYYNNDYNNDYNFDDFSYELEKNYPEMHQSLIEKINKINIQNCKIDFNKEIEELYKDLKIKENSKDMKNIIIDLLKILVIKEKIEERKCGFRDRSVYLNRGVRNYNPYIDF